MDQALKEILDRAAKLKNLADRAGTPEEAAVAAIKLQELLLRYNLDMQSVTNTTAKEDYLEEVFLIHENRNHKTWAAGLYHNIAKALQCAAVQDYYRKGVTPNMTIVGRRHNIQVVNYLYAYLSGEIKRLAMVATQKVAKRDKVTFHRAFCVGAACTVSNRVIEMYEEVRTESFGNNALMVVEDHKVKARIKELFPKTHTARSTYTSPEGYREGKRAGKNIPLNRGVDGKSVKQLT
jgi:hypothetical protein